MTDRLDELLALQSKFHKELTETEKEILAEMDRIREAVIPSELPSPREREVLVLVRQGLINKEIADKLHISVRTVKFHITQLMRIFKVHSRVKL